jgi:hypothetical protein
VIVVLSLPFLAHGSELRPLLEAIRTVETGTHPDPTNALGDGGRSLGPYQIQERYWSDSRMRGRYDQVRNKLYAESTIVRYWRRYAPHALACVHAPTLARVHNGGPAGDRNPRTLGYWYKVKRAMCLKGGGRGNG